MRDFRELKNRRRENGKNVVALNIDSTFNVVRIMRHLLVSIVGVCGIIRWRRRWWWCLICSDILQDIKIENGYGLLKHVVDLYKFLSLKFYSKEGSILKFCTARKWTSSTSCIKHNRSHKPFPAFYLHNIIKTLFFLLLSKSKLFHFKPRHNVKQKGEKHKIKISSEKL